MTPEETFDRVWDILVAQAGADLESREDFIRAHAKKAPQGNLTEWRFCGHLGLGGKFRCDRSARRYLVTCYPEDETADRKRVMEETNLKLAEVPWCEVGGVQ